jgi:hypothetical protein
MAIILTKGSTYSANFSSSDYPALTSDWTGEAKFYLTFPGTAALTKTLTRVDNAMALSLTLEDIMALTNGTYSMVITLTNAVISVTIQTLYYVTVVAVPTLTVDMCKIFGTVIKTDTSAAGSEKLIMAMVNGTLTSVSTWNGVQITVKSASASVVDADVVGIEQLTTLTSNAGYFEVYVIRGLTVTVSCSSFGKSITVDTTGHTTFDISQLI